MKIFRVRLLRPYGSNNAGEECGFPEEEARQLVDSGAAESAEAAEEAPPPGGKPAVVTSDVVKPPADRAVPSPAQRHRR